MLLILRKLQDSLLVCVESVIRSQWTRVFDLLWRSKDRRCRPPGWQKRKTTAVLSAYLFSPKPQSSRDAQMHKYSCIKGESLLVIEIFMIRSTYVCWWSCKQSLNIHSNFFNTNTHEKIIFFVLKIIRVIHTIKIWLFHITTIKIQMYLHKYSVLRCWICFLRSIHQECKPTRGVSLGRRFFKKSWPVSTLHPMKWTKVQFCLFHLFF